MRLSDLNDEQLLLVAERFPRWFINTRAGWNREIIKGVFGTQHPGSLKHLRPGDDPELPEEVEALVTNNKEPQR